MIQINFNIKVNNHRLNNVKTYILCFTMIIKRKNQFVESNQQEHTISCKGYLKIIG